MYTASRHAQSIAENFLADVDDFQRASREADRRAMSHFDTVASSEVGLASGYPRTRRSFSVVRYGMPTNSDYGRTRYWSSSVDPVRQSTYAPSVTLVGSRYPRRQDYIPQYGYLPTKKVYDRAYPYSYYYPGRYYSYPSSYFYDDYVPASRYLHNYYPRTYLSQLPNYYNHYASRHYPYDGCNDILPTSHLHASTGPKPNWEFLSRPTLTRRWWSSSDLLSDVSRRSIREIVEVSPPCPIVFEEACSRGPALFTSPVESQLYYRSPRTTMVNCSGMRNKVEDFSM